MTEKQTDQETLPTNDSSTTSSTSTAKDVHAVLSETDLEELQNSIQIFGLSDETRKTITNPVLQDLIIINVTYKQNESSHFQDMNGVEKAYQMLQAKPSSKILLLSTLDLEHTKSLASFRNARSLELQVLLAHPQCRFLEMPTTPEQINDSFALKKESDIQQQFEAEKAITKQHISIIHHSLTGQKVHDPYNPTNDRERAYVQEAFALTQTYFPGLDTIEKMLDFVLNVQIDIPEVMSGQRIEGVYVDIDGTLIDYVPIGSPLEGTQQLRPKVVALLKQYESEGKKIIIRTGGDVAMKEAYLRNLGITWPVVSKYDYAGATAEIVVDDTDKGAFVLQSKIWAETYIDTRDMN